MTWEDKRSAPTVRPQTGEAPVFSLMYFRVIFSFLGAGITFIIKIILVFFFFWGGVLGENVELAQRTESRTHSLTPSLGSAGTTGPSASALGSASRAERALGPGGPGCFPGSPLLSPYLGVPTPPGTRHCGPGRTRPHREAGFPARAGCCSESGDWLQGSGYSPVLLLPNSFVSLRLVGPPGFVSPGMDFPL